MDVHPPPNTPPVPQDTGERGSSHGVVLSATNHTFWDQEGVPGPDSDEFQRWISVGEVGGIKKSATPKFVPKDRHCGIWNSSPNKSCHSSFGDQGTTASTNCFGDIIQLTQYLGAGRSGLFSMDQKTTDEPYFVCGRARDLDDLVKNTGASFSYDLILPPEFFPEEPLNVKWVNWRWPRYEYDTTVSVSKVKASAQWVVHNGIVLKQLILENTGHKDVEFDFTVTNDMLIRDLDYLDSAYHFNDLELGYSFVPGPNGFGYVCIHTLQPPAETEASGNVDALRSSQRSATGEHGQGPPTGPEPAPTTPHQNISPIPIMEELSAHTQTVQPQPDIAAQTFNPSNDAQLPPPTLNEPEKTRIENDKESEPQPNKSYAVASVITIFVNGKALKTQGSFGSHTFTIAGNNLNSTEHHGSTLELVMSYKMILIPNESIDWRNFLVSAQDADVNDILQRETKSLWDDFGGSSLLSMELSQLEVETDGQDTASKVSTTESTGDLSNKRTDQGSEGDRSDAGSAAPNERTTTKTGGGDARRTHNREIPSSKAENHGIFGIPTGTPGKTSPRNHIEYLMWRHLEHILSVCAVPLSTPDLFELSGSPRSSPRSNPATLHKSAADTPVALTCGDMAGHRICTSASFFAFKFLIDVARRLESCGKDCLYIQNLRRRIKTVCEGHILWLKRLQPRFPAEPQKPPGHFPKSGCFAANYWVTGFITPKGSNTWQPDDTVTDTPLQILKIVEYRRICNNEDERKALDEHLLQIWTPWLLELDKVDRRSMYAWPHAFREDVNIFRLDDHVWVWRALKSLENLGLWKKLPSLTSIRNGKVSGEDPILKSISQFYGPEWDKMNERDILEKFDKIAKRLSPGDVQRNVLQRFTSENDLDVSRKRMLAVTRSPRETRFLLHSRDTSLFYGEDLGFFLPESPYHELWENTLAAQMHHDENKETNWDNAIRYALGIVAGTRHSPLNNKDPTELVRNCVEVLIRSSSHNGFLPGQLEEATKEPRLFYEEEDANFYYHASFEINHILLTYAGRIERTLQKGPKYPSRPGSLRSSATMPSMMDKDTTTQSALIEILMALATQPKRQRLNEQVQQGPGLSLTQYGVATGLDARRSLTMKKLIPFNNLIDVSSINALEDEWLYNYPQFFTTEGIDLEQYVDMRLKSTVLSRDTVGEIIGKELRLHRVARAQQTFRSPSESTKNATFIAETPKKKHLGKREKRELEFESLPDSLTNKKLWDKLSVVRTAKKAKKRFIWLYHANAETAFLCWAASPEAEKPAMSLFFDRHSKYEKHVWDDTTMVVNTWQTELHLSFYQLVDAALPSSLGLPSLSKDPFPGGSKKELRRASLGFRFDGDFFDRYWTCHYIEHIDQEPPMEGWDFPFQFSGRHEGKQWWQRKVLELYLLYRILGFTTKSSLAILKQVRDELGIEDSTLSLSILDNDAYYVSTQENWQRFEYILQGVDEDLSAVLRTLEKWDRRETERGQEKPRWTRNDERKYRGFINKLQGATEKQTRDLESHRNSIRKLKETLTTKRERIRDDRELHRNENIRYFTYVTVIFLPLGFAASFYSMNGAPTHALTISLVEFAIAAFGVTVGLLASAKVIFGAVDVVLLPLQSLRKQTELKLEKVSRNKKNRSLLHGDQNERLYHENATKDEEQASALPTLRTTSFQLSTPSEGAEGRQVSSPRHNAQESSTSSALVWFWLTYVFFEVPGLRIVAAVAVLDKRKLSPHAAVEVVMGIISLPIFGFAWVCKFVALNLQDFARLLVGVRRSCVPARSNVPAVPNANPDENLRRHFDNITRAPRPFKGMEKWLEERKSKDSRPPSSQPVKTLVENIAKGRTDDGATSGHEQQ